MKRHCDCPFPLKTCPFRRQKIKNNVSLFPRFRTHLTHIRSTRFNRSFNLRAPTKFSQSNFSPVMSPPFHHYLRFHVDVTNSLLLHFRHVIRIVGGVTLPFTTLFKTLSHRSFDFVPTSTHPTCDEFLSRRKCNWSNWVQTFTDSDPQNLGLL